MCYDAGMIPPRVLKSKKQALLAILLFFLPGEVEGAPAPSIQQVKGTAEFRGALRVPLFPEADGQVIRRQTISPEPDDLESDPDGNRLAVFRRPPDRVRVSFEASLSRVDRVLDSQRIAPYEKAGVLFRRHTRSEGQLRLTPFIRQIAQEATGAERNPLKKARRIQAWLLAHPVKDHKNQHAVRFSAMCRASEVPARLVSGFLLDGSSRLWAEFYLPRFGWVPVDGPSFGKIGGDHLVLARGAAVPSGGRLAIAGTYEVAKHFSYSPFRLEVPLPQGWRLEPLQKGEDAFAVRMTGERSTVLLGGRRFPNPRGLGIQEIALDALKADGLAGLEEDYLYRKEITGYRIKTKEGWRAYFLKEDRLFWLCSERDPEGKVLMGLVDSLTIK